MYIVPQSVFRILNNVPFNSDMKHTILFPNVNAQTSFFESKVKHNFHDFTYVRQTNTVKVPVAADSLYDCNYCMFKNPRIHSSKWFYGFITGVDYISENVSEISFQIDYFQTWLFDISIGKCFVEREHVKDDTIGKHTVEEPVSIGENVVSHSIPLYFGNGLNLEDNTWRVKITANPSLISELHGQWTTEKQGNQIVATNYSFDMNNDIEELNTWLNEEAILGNEITSMTMYPKFFETKYDISFNPMDNGCSRPTDFSDLFQYTVTDAYVPKNNKLFTYPYTFLRVSNNQGQTVDYKWENMRNGKTDFKIYHYVGNSVACELRPIDYESLFNRQYSIGINEFPTVSFLQNTGISNVMKAMSGFLGNVASTISYSTSSSSRTGSGGSTSQNESKSNNDTYTKTTRYPLRKGSTSYVRTKSQAQGSSVMTSSTDSYSSSDATSSGFNPMAIAETPLNLLGMLGNSCTRVNGSSQGNMDIRWNTYGFIFYCMTIKKEYAKLIDDYFTRFGYQVNEYKVPEMNSRSAFNFVKTVDCNVTGSAPNEALEVISAIFDSGITLWHTSDVGNYDIENHKQ